MTEEDRAPALDPSLLRRLERLAIVARKAVRGMGPGERRARRHGTSVEFADYRAYTPGDDTRRIDWYAYARLDALVLKLYQGEQDLALHLLVDQSGSMGTGAPSKLEYARHVAAALAYVGLAAGDRVVVRLVRGAERGGEAGGALPPLRGKASLRRLLHGLDRDHQATGVTSLAAAVQAFVARRPPIGVVVLVSDLLDPGGIEAPLRGLSAAGHEVHVVHVVSPEEVEPAVGQDVELVDAETGETAAVAMDLPAVKAYRAAWTAWAAGVANACRRAEAGYVLARTDVPFETLVLDVLRRRSMVR